MQYAANQLNETLGIGSYVGEIRQAPDGQLYEWVEGVDGLGNPIGFWKAIKAIGRGLKTAAGRAMPLVKSIARRAMPLANFIPGVGPIIAKAGSLAQQAGILGEIAEGPDGQLYEYVEAVDGLGNAVGFWKPIRRAVSKIGKKVIPSLVKKIPFSGTVRRFTGPFCRYLPRLEPCVRQIPRALPVYRAGNKVCRVLKKVGLAGTDGNHYEMVEGIGEFGEPVRLIIPADVKRGPAPTGMLPGRRRRRRRYRR